VGDLRIGIGAPGNREGAYARPSPEQRIPDHDPRGGIGGVGEFPLEADVSRRIDPGIVRPEEIVHMDAVPLVVCHARLLEPHPPDVRDPPGADKDLVDRHFGFDAVPVHAHDFAFLRAADLDDPGGKRHVDAVRPEGAMEDLRRVRVFPRQKPRDLFDDRHLRAEPPERLGEFASERPRPEHEEPPRQAGQGKNRFVGQESGLFEAVDGRDEGARARGDHGPGKPQRPAVDLHGVRPGEPGIAEEDVHAQAGKPLHGVIAADARPQGAHPFHHGREVRGTPIPGADAVAGGVPDVVRGPGRTDEALGRHAPDVQAVAPEKVPLHERHLGAQARRAGRRHEPRGPRADDHQVVVRRGLGIHPVGGMDVGNQLHIVDVLGEHPSLDGNGFPDRFHGFNPL
jgi:hypothetical protein